MYIRHREKHKTQHIGWLRAAVLGANDGIISTASLLVGIAAANASSQALLITGLAAIVAGAMSMAAGEYVSVSSQADTELADLARERKELEVDYEHEIDELASIYQSRGVESVLARAVAVQMMEHDALAAHARDELGISDVVSAKPVQAAITSAITFSTGAILPLAVALLLPSQHIVMGVSLISVVLLILLGGISAYVGGSSLIRAASRVGGWGVLAMLVTAGVGHYLGMMI